MSNVLTIMRIRVYFAEFWSESCVIKKLNSLIAIYLTHISYELVVYQHSFIVNIYFLANSFIVNIYF